MRFKTLFLQSAFAGALCTSLAAGQDFQRDYTLAAGGIISIRNVAGSIKVAGYDGSKILVAAYKEGRDRDQVEIVDAGPPDFINLYVQYPGFGNTDARVDFEILSPRSEWYRFEEISSVSGDVDVSSIAGQFRLRSISGSVRLHDVYGSADAWSISGDVVAGLSLPSPGGDMQFGSISGDVVVRAPAALDANVMMSTLSGLLWTDFPIRITWRWPFWGRSASGRLGAGTTRLTMASISGRVCLLANR